jgi:hypothetical protein
LIAEDQAFDGISTDVAMADKTYSLIDEIIEKFNAHYANAGAEMEEMIDALFNDEDLRMNVKNSAPSAYEYAASEKLSERINTHMLDGLITGNQDKIDYYNELSGVTFDRKNAWVNDKEIISGVLWSNNILNNFYVDLNLCGKKNIYNMIEDYGCPINIQDKNVKLDNFISDVLTIFLNGRVFYDEFEVGKLTTSNHKSNGGSNIIGYYGFGKNIILPKFKESPLDQKIVFMPIDSDIVYYDFMVDDNDVSKSNYHKWFAEGKISEGKNLFETKYNKYKCK